MERSIMELARDFFYDEVRSGFYVPGIMKRAWGAAFTILLEIDRICKKHNIPYYLGFGTLLGAVRNQDFIPWDDDIDIMMFREDYNRFSDLLEEELPKELEFISIEKEREFHGLNAVVCTNQNRFREDVFPKYCNYPYSAFVDIFALDELAYEAEEESYRKSLIAMLLKMIDVMRERGERSEEAERDLKEVEEIFQVHFDRDSSLEGQIRQFMDQVFQCFNGGGGSHIAAMPIYLMRGSSYPISSFDKTKFLSFCGRDFPVPGDYEKILEIEYGDYRKKTKAGGEHNYPCFKAQEEHLSLEHRDNWIFRYHFSEEDMERERVESFRNLVLKTADQLLDAQKKLEKEYLSGNPCEVLASLSARQEEAIALGNIIEQKKGEGTEAVALLEHYCEALFEAHQSLQESKLKEEEQDAGVSPEEKKELSEKMQKPASYLKHLHSTLEKEWKREIVFLVHSAKHFESIRPLFDALQDAGDADCKLMPIPYFDRLGDGSLSEMHYEGEAFPEGYTITDYQSYDFGMELPDCIVLNSPYDDVNAVWTVDPFFYSKEMKKFTGKLLYIPWFVTEEIDPQAEEDGKAFYNMKYYVTVPGVFHADLTIVQSEAMKKAYLAKIESFYGSEVRNKMEKKISGAGSCLFGEKKGQGTKEVLEEFKSFLQK